MERSGEARGENDDAIAVPGSAARILRSGEWDRGPAAEADLFECSVGEETDLSPVRRPERPGRPLRSRQRSGRESVKRLDEQDVSAIRGPGDEGEHSTIGRDLDRAGFAAQEPERRAVWSIDRGANDAHVRSRAAAVCDRKSESGQCERQAETPDQPLAAADARRILPRRRVGLRRGGFLQRNARFTDIAQALPRVLVETPNDQRTNASEEPRRAVPTSQARTPESSRSSPRPCRPQTPRGRSTFRRARSRRPRCRCACRPAVRAPARGSCRPRCRRRRRATPHRAGGASVSVRR